LPLIGSIFGQTLNPVTNITVYQLQGLPQMVVGQADRLYVGGTGFGNAQTVKLLGRYIDQPV